MFIVTYCIHLEEHLCRNQTLCVKDVIKVMGGKKKHEGESSTGDSIGRGVEKHCSLAASDNKKLVLHYCLDKIDQVVYSRLCSMLCNIHAHVYILQVCFLDKSYCF